ncbi:mannose-1-phosphate guanylyltransferase [Pseudoalteromonas sp. S4389]|uniref:nucleotidyltransferase family protein n=1 Tax=Pseudoalteromonas sp. S4389 TaxID=579556 RepID=UPI001107F1A5|nr:nucleotidyltransferase family protein [Pseudoalteromonas sp. S4389]TMO44823.1 mannose-1-phosphate guanylyltransferase [Pseudoalteromonas sp. S4389]
MKAILLAAGLGTRLRPITNTIPKCLVPINGRPLLALWLEKLVNLGVEEILINTHYFAEQVEKFIKNSPYKEKVTLVKEEKLLGTGGTLITNVGFWKDDTTLVIHADNYCEDNLTNLIKAHNERPKGCEATLLLFKTNTPESCGIVTLDNSGVINGFYEKKPNPPGNLASGALFLFSPGVYSKYFSHFKVNSAYEISLDFVPLLINKLYSYQTNLRYIDIGTPMAYQSVQG